MSTFLSVVGWLIVLAVGGWAVCLLAVAVGAVYTKFKPAPPPPVPMEDAEQRLQHQMHEFQRLLTDKEIDALIDEAITSAELTERTRLLLGPYFIALKLVIKSFKWQVHEIVKLRSSPGLKWYIERMSDYITFGFPETTLSSPFYAWPRGLPRAPIFDFLLTENRTLRENESLSLYEGVDYLSLNHVVGENHPLYKLLEDACAPFKRPQPPPLPYTNAKRFEHTQIVGGSGAGKTTLLSHLILHDLKQPDPPCVILIDPKNLVIPKLSKLALFDGPLKDRLIVLSPEYKPSINIFDNTGRGTVGAIDSLMYLCSALSTEFTTLQQGLAANLARLLLVFPQTLGRNATLADLRALMVDKFPEGDYRKAVSGLRPAQQEFFDKGGFDNSEYREAKRQIRRRLDQMIGSEHLESLFYSQHSAINIAEEMQKGSIILVDCAERLMDTQDEASAFGCVFIAEVMRAIRQRNALPDDQRRPCFLFVDEAATFFRGDMNYFFEGARQCHVGGTFAFHYLQQKNMADLKETMMNMTGTKLVSKRAKEDANAFAIHMGYRGSPSDFGQFLDSLPEYHFALSIAGVQDKAVGISAPPDGLDNESLMSDAAYSQFIAANRKRVSGGAQQRTPPPGATAPPPDSKWTGPKPTWTQADVLDLADTYAQLAVAERRGDTARAAELRERITNLEAKRAAAQEPGDEYHL